VATKSNFLKSLANGQKIKFGFLIGPISIILKPPYYSVTVRDTHALVPLIITVVVSLNGHLAHIHCCHERVLK